MDTHVLCFDTSFLVPTLENNNTCSSIMASCSQTMEAQAAKQRQEIDQYIRLQNERLRLVLQEQRKQQLAMLLKKIESTTQVLLKQKDDEITQANRRRMELEDFLRKLEAENQAWQRVAQENEAMVVSLNNTLEQYRERVSCCLINGADDAESCCDNREEEEAESDGVDYEQIRMKMKVCKSCNSRSSCVLFLPCRHLCSCKACEAVLDCCPVCRTPKKASIEALIF
ncbi:probable BOI-related E3 ubiquitin-protein ligase 3 [Prunus persica]|uniref:probable BOI-related E3 ubiquitin-protein ligase 3 n=1 Tax=Prunus persica TaxID=3760 RepID=UPI0009AB3977|nr:probable BOI-related E3 ubiquitin-protein ligase 3 [Prunus persica]